MGRTMTGWAMALLLAAGCMVIPMKAHARHGEGNEDRVAMFSNLRVSEDEPANDVVCAFCTVTIDGDVHGDVAVIFSTVTLNEGRTVSGDVATLFSTLVMREDSRVNGDLATALGTVNLAESAHVNGDRTVFASGLGLTVVLAPLLIVVGVIWLLVWLVRRTFL